MKILIADDDSVGSEINKRLILSCANRNTTNDTYIKIVTNGYEAVDCYRESILAGEPFDLILLDRKMPYFDGEYALNKIRQLEQRLSIRTLNISHIVIVTSKSPRGEVLTIAPHCVHTC